jgi:hypothetical protein
VGRHLTRLGSGVPDVPVFRQVSDVPDVPGLWRLVSSEIDVPVLD